jgi:hypothetical protein
MIGGPDQRKDIDVIHDIVYNATASVGPPLPSPSLLCFLRPLFDLERSVYHGWRNRLGALK